MEDSAKGRDSFKEYLDDESGSVAIIIKQQLRPAEGPDGVVFPPTYPISLHSNNNDYGRKNNKEDKEENKEEKGKSGYNIDPLKDGNICEIDSPQSQANRIEPLFKVIKNGKLVPQITITVREDGEKINLLDAGHRSADALVRFSSIVPLTHKAFEQVKKGNHLAIAQIAPTSLLFGVWDSRGTRVKIQRIIKAEIRATNVEELKRSSVFNPAIDYVTDGGVDEKHDKQNGPKNPLSRHGMKHALDTRAVGGVLVRGDIIRTVNINLVAIRGLKAFTDGVFDLEKTRQLQEYILGLALLSATYNHPSALNLREGCHLCHDNNKKEMCVSKAVYLTGEEKPFTCDAKDIEAYAEQSAKAFFGERYDRKDIPDAVFEANVANEFLGMSEKDQDKLACSGPITKEAIQAFKEKNSDPIKLIIDAVKEVKDRLPKKSKGKNIVPTIDAEIFTDVRRILNDLESDDTTKESIVQLVQELSGIVDSGQDAHSIVKECNDKLGEFKKKKKASQAEGAADKASEDSIS